MSVIRFIPMMCSGRQSFIAAFHVRCSMSRVVIHRLLLVVWTWRTVLLRASTGPTTAPATATATAAACAFGTGRAFNAWYRWLLRLRLFCCGCWRRAMLGASL